MADGQVAKSSGQVNQEVIAVKLDIVKLNELLDFCTEARTRAEIQEFCGISSRDYFRKNSASAIKQWKIEVHNPRQAKQ